MKSPEESNCDEHVNIESAIPNEELEIERSEIPLNSGTANYKL